MGRVPKYKVQPDLEPTIHHPDQRRTNSSGTMNLFLGTLRPNLRDEVPRASALDDSQQSDLRQAARVFRDNVKRVRCCSRRQSLQKPDGALDHLDELDELDMQLSSLADRLRVPETPQRKTFEWISETQWAASLHPATRSYRLQRPLSPPRPEDAPLRPLSRNLGGHAMRSRPESKTRIVDRPHEPGNGQPFWIHRVKSAPREMAPWEKARAEVPPRVTSVAPAGRPVTASSATTSSSSSSSTTAPSSKTSSSSSSSATTGSSSASSWSSKLRWSASSLSTASTPVKSAPSTRA